MFGINFDILKLDILKSSNYIGIIIFDMLDTSKYSTRKDNSIALYPGKIIFLPNNGKLATLSGGSSVHLDIHLT